MTSRTLRATLAPLYLAGAFCGMAAHAAPSERLQLCKGSPPARPDEMIVVDSSFRRMPDRVLRLGTIDLSLSHHVATQFFIVAPLGASPAARLDSSKIHAAIGSLAKCGDKTVFGLSFEIDASATPSGDFSIPLTVFREGSDPDSPALAAAPATVAGTFR